MSKEDHYRPQHRLDGSVTQSGISGRNWREEPAQIAPKLGLYRGIVTETFSTDNEKVRGKDGETDRQVEVECDVLMERSMMVIPRIPVMQRGSDVNNERGLWIPTPTTGTVPLDGANPIPDLGLSKTGVNPLKPATVFDQYNGEIVIVQFLDGDPHFPIITGSVTHNQAKRRLKEGGGWSQGTESEQRGFPELGEWFVSHFGLEMRINDSGDLLIDSKGAFTDRETEDSSGDGGEIRIRLKDTKRFTIQVGGVDFLEVWKDGSNLVFDIGEGATENLIRGNKAITWLLAHVHPDAFGGTAPALDLQGGVTLSVDGPSPNARVL
jgi:hypothetical protein